MQLGVSPTKLRATSLPWDDKGGIQDDNGNFRQKRDPRMRSIAEVIKETHPEYATAHFGKWHVYGHTPEEFGYDQSDGPTDNSGGNERDFGDDPKEIFSLTERSLDFIREQAAAGNPFFLQISHYANHYQTQARDKIRERYETMRPGRKDIHPGYAAMNEDLDRSLGIIMNALETLGIADETYIIYTSDNGGRSNDRHFLADMNLPLRKGKVYLHEGGIRVPFVVAGPGVLPNSVCYEPVIGYDILPTIADWLSIEELPGGIEGGSFRHLLSDPEGKAVERKDPFMVWHLPHRFGTHKAYVDSAIRKGRYKLIKNWNGDFVELYDLRVDIEEQTNLASQKPELAEHLERTLMDYLERVNAEEPDLEHELAER